MALTSCTALNSRFSEKSSTQLLDEGWVAKISAEAPESEEAKVYFIKPMTSFYEASKECAATSCFLMSEVTLNIFMLSLIPIWSPFACGECFISCLVEQCCQETRCSEFFRNSTLILNCPPNEETGVPSAPISTHLMRQACSVNNFLIETLTPFSCCDECYQREVTIADLEADTRLPAPINL